MNQIKVGILLSYDYAYLRAALPYVYAQADEIVLCMDADGLTWSGTPFVIPEEFFAWVTDFDHAQKIRIYRDSFYVAALSPSACDTRQRNMLGRFMGPGGWHVQLDADEYFIGFDRFCAFLHELDAQGRSRRPVTVTARWIPLFKQLDDGFLYVDTDEETFPVATNTPEYTCCRDTRQKKIRTSFQAAHQSWARPAAEIAWKINNWSHKDDFDSAAYLALWNRIDRDNHASFRDIHPMTPATWPRLRFVPARDIPEFIASYTRARPAPAPKAGLLARLAQKIRPRVPA